MYSQEDAEDADESFRIDGEWLEPAFAGATPILACEVFNFWSQCRLSLCYSLSYSWGYVPLFA